MLKDTLKPRDIWSQEQRLELLRAIIYVFTRIHQLDHIRQGCFTGVIKRFMRIWPEVGYEFGQEFPMRYYSRQLQEDLDQLDHLAELIAFSPSKLRITYLSPTLLGRGAARGAYETIRPNYRGVICAYVRVELADDRSQFRFLCPT